jgi:hypothetical protein
VLGTPFSNKKIALFLTDWGVCVVAFDCTRLAINYQLPIAIVALVSRIIVEEEEEEQQACAHSYHSNWLSSG